MGKSNDELEDCSKETCPLEKNPEFCGWFGEKKCYFTELEVYRSFSESLKEPPICSRIKCPLEKNPSSRIKCPLEKNPSSCYHYKKGKCGFEKIP